MTVCLFVCLFCHIDISLSTTVGDVCMGKYNVRPRHLVLDQNLQLTPFRGTTRILDPFHIGTPFNQR